MSISIPSVAIAESCTGGLVMARIVATPGSGDWFKGEWWPTTGKSRRICSEWNPARWSLPPQPARWLDPCESPRIRPRSRHHR